MSSGAALAAVAKSNKTKAPEAEANTENTAATAAPVEGASEGTEAAEGEAAAEVEVDVDKLSGAELDKLIADYEIAAPDGWKSMKVAAKRAWLKEQFAERPEEAGEAEVGDEVPEVQANGDVPSEPVSDEAWEAATPVDTQSADPVATGTALVPAKAGGKKASSKDVAKVLTGEVMPAGVDPIQEVVHLVENLKETQARGLVAAVANTSDFAAFKLGGLLSVIQTKGWFAPYGSFREYVETEVGMDYRKATYWTKIYNDLANSGVSWERIKHVPWTKLKEITGILTVENVDEWVPIAEKHTTLQLTEIVKAHKAKAAGKTVEIGGDVKVVTTMTFKVHEDQKATVKGAIAKAKETVGVDAADTVAMEHICLDFLNNAPTVPQTLKKLGIEKAIEMFDLAFPDAKLSLELPNAEDAAA